MKVSALLIGLAVIVGACGGDGAASTTAATAAQDPCPRSGAEFDTKLLYIEHNATDEDTGVHGAFGGEAWSDLCVWDPAGRLILEVHPRNSLGDLRVADLFFESREPPNDEYTLDDLRADFPEGSYTVGGTDFEGVARAGTAMFTHVIPSPPVIVSPVVVDDEEDAAGAAVQPSDVVVEWQPVTESLVGGSVSITAYEVIITKVDHEDPNGFSRPVYDVHVGAEVHRISVPVEFFESGTVYELEVLAIETSGNQTITVGFFSTT